METMEIRRLKVSHENQCGMCAVFFPSPPSPYMMLSAVTATVLSTHILILKIRPKGIRDTKNISKWDVQKKI